MRIFGATGNRLARPCRGRMMHRRPPGPVPGLPRRRFRGKNLALASTGGECAGSLGGIVLPPRLAYRSGQLLRSFPVAGDAPTPVSPLGAIAWLLKSKSAASTWRSEEHTSELQSPL